MVETQVLQAVATWQTCVKNGFKTKQDLDSFTAATDAIVTYRNRKLKQIDASPIALFKELLLRRMRYFEGKAVSNPPDAELETAWGNAEGVCQQIKAEAAGDDTPSPHPSPRGDKIALALSILIQHPEWSNRQIAEAAACNKNYLSQSARFKATRKAIKTSGQESQRRTKKSRGSDMDEYQYER